MVSDSENDNRYWMRNNSEWIFGVKELERGKIRSGVVKHVVDGDTVDVSFGKYIHSHTLKTSGEEITCLEFVDANEKRYDNWIPAIKLE